MKLWSLKIDGQLSPVAFRTRDEIREWAARRKMSAGEYQEAYAGYWKSRPMRLWKAVLRNHPDAKIVRVNVELA